MNGNFFISSKHKLYPALLKQIYAPPQKLYYQGNPEYLNKTCISIVGTRRASEYGEIMTEKIVEELAVLDIAIVSGLAKGIDTFAHKSALKYNLPTIAVLGSGIDNIYPLENIELAQEIIRDGLIISEFPGMEEPKKTNFPRRNRILSGLSIATILIEAPEKSGALITCDFALEQGREIFVITGDVDRENSRGPLKLLQKGGAYPISSGQDVIEVLKRQPHLKLKNSPAKIRRPDACPVPAPPRLQYNLSPLEQQIFDLLSSRREKSLEQIYQQINLDLRQILSLLSLLEIKGLVFTNHGKYLRKC